MSKLHADYYADAIHQLDTAIVRNEKIAEETFLVRVAVPEIARDLVPGQFVMIRMSGTNEPLIGRALAVYDVTPDTDGNPHWIDLVYLRKGTLTTVLAASPIGTRVTLWGPLGNGFASRPCDRLIMAVGGIGQTPMLLLGREAIGTQAFGSPARENGWAKHIEFIYGARRSSLLAGVNDFQAANFRVTLCTDDGSAGVKRRVPEVVAGRLAELPKGERVRVVTCGPEIMMRKVAEACAAAAVDCQVSMETPMACGIGICFSCVAQVRLDEPEASGSNADGTEEWDYKRTCVEGPIFDAHKICWD